MKRIFPALVILAIISWGCSSELRLADPVAVLAEGKIIDIAGLGHAAPFYADVDGDSIPDLLVGEFEGGQCRIYHNYGNATHPEFRDFSYLESEGEIAVIPPS